jgi:Lipopolysaccharide kinase (Kdo/WaaP) family/Glycosyltransferase family 9 (heptosyltransferase)
MRRQMRQMVQEIRKATGVAVRSADAGTLARLEACRYRAVRHGGWHGFAMRGIEESGDIGRIISISEAVRGGAATPIKQRNGRTAATMPLRVDGRHLLAYVKEDDLGAMGARKLLKDNIQVSRPWKTWQRTLQLQAAGVAVQRPIAVLEYRRLGLVRKAVYVGEYAPDAVSLARLLEVGAPAQVDRDHLLVALAVLVRRLHDRGFYHGDLKTGNLLAVRHPDRWDVRLIDLEGVAVKRRLTDADRAIDLGRLWLSLVPVTTAAERERFLELYAAIEPPVDRTLQRGQIEQRIRFLQTRRFGNLPAVGARLQTVLSDRGEQPWPWLIVALGSPEQVGGMASLLAALRRLFPSVQVDVMARPEALPALEGHQDVRAIMTVSAGWRRRVTPEGCAMTMFQALTAVRSSRYAVAIDLTDQWDSALLTRATGAPVRIGYRRASVFSKWPKRMFCYTQMILTKPGQRDPARHYLLVAEALGPNEALPAGDGMAVGSSDGLEAASSLSRTQS